KTRLRKPEENLRFGRMLMTDPIRIKIELLVTKIKVLLVDMEAQNATKTFVAGSQFMNAFSQMMKELKRILPEMNMFEDPPEEKEYIKEETGVTKLDSAYESRMIRSGNVTSYIYSVSDGVTTTLRGLGVDNNTIKSIRGVISNEIFSRPGLDKELVSMISDRIINNVTEGI
ncbi:MAG: hypothetical protein U9M89_02035, partial [Patescibacteria group bacterium]|nr:hypothetical protein [Patescibacteria group bacterium]